MNSKQLMPVLLIFLSGISQATPDPFIKTWVNFDGVNTRKLIISDSKYKPNQGLYYVEAVSKFIYDPCTAISSNIIHCTNGYGVNETLVRDDVNFTLTANNNFESLVFYDPDHQPPLPAIVGYWEYSDSKRNIDYSLQIVKGNTNSDFYIGSSSGNKVKGFTCHQRTDPDHYFMTVQPDGKQLFTRPNPGLPPEFSKYFLYDPVKNQITRAPDAPDPTSIFIGDCVELETDIMNIEPVFTKQPG